MSLGSSDCYSDPSWRGAKERSSSLEGLLGATILDEINVDYLFTSANGFSSHAGLTDFNVYEVELKKRMVKKVHQVVALIDHTKLGKTSIATFAQLDDISIVITNKEIESDFAQALERAEVQVINVND
ncbi:hypothetical protein [Bacillus sp. JCM 19041]|uniref:hypothetical protein n=1 Tax=Bacillus sp. JCM 19041 TaxID=1460637 RepID=UPI000A6E3442